MNANRIVSQLQNIIFIHEECQNEEKCFVINKKNVSKMTKSKWLFRNNRKLRMWFRNRKSKKGSWFLLRFKFHFSLKKEKRKTCRRRNVNTYQNTNQAVFMFWIINYWLLINIVLRVTFMGELNLIAFYCGFYIKKLFSSS